MKKYLLSILLIFSSICSIKAVCPISFERNMFTKAIGNNVNEDEWIFIGEVTLSRYNGSETIKANLYVREIAKKLIYRVEYQGINYATRWADNIKTYLVTINEKTYVCDVPIASGDSDTTDAHSLEYIGKWKRGRYGSWDVNISFYNGKYSFDLNPLEFEEISDIQETSNGVIFTYIVKYDHKPELRKKGWRYYEDDRDNNADPGYPTKGKYYYDRTVCYYTVSISISDDGPVFKGIKMRSLFYLDSSLTYSETDTTAPVLAQRKMIKL